MEPLWPRGDRVVRIATLTCLGMPLSVARLAMEMSSPLALAAVSLAMTDERRRQWTTRAAELGAVLVMLASVGVMLGLASGVAVASPHVWLSLLFCQAAVCLGMATATTGRVRSTVLTAAATCAAVWQLMLLVGLTQHVFVLATMLVLRRNDDEPSRLARATQWTSRLALTFSSVSTLLISLGRMLVGDAEWSLFGLVAAQVAAMVTAGLVERHPAWRRVFGVLATGQVAMGLLVINSLSVLSFMQRVEILLTFSGLMTLAAGVVGWYRETDRRDPWVDFNLAFGSLLGAAPLAVGLVLQRFGFNSADWGWVVAHEVGTLAVGLALLAVGVLCRFRATTIAGATALTVYVVSLVGLIALPDRLQTTAVYMMVGGGLFFGSAVLLSVYRDRLLALPNRVREGKGVFQVLKWR
jgi:hypothetical protein